MKQNNVKNSIDYKRYFYILMTIVIFFTPFGCNSKTIFSLTSVQSDNQSAIASKQHEPITYQIKSVVRVIDGDTFEADLLSLNESEIKTIRLAGVNSPETFDQNCWKEAKDFTIKWLSDKKEIFADIIGTDIHNSRSVAFVYSKEPEASLEVDLVNNGFAYPVLNYLENSVNKERFEDFKKTILEAQKYAIENVKPDELSVWSANQNIVKISAITNTDKSNESKDEIILSLVDQTSSVELLGYSLMEESSDPRHRFFFPKLSLDQDHPTITIYIGVKDGINWVSKDRNEVCVMSDQDWLNDEGDTVYLRDPDRRIIAYFICDPVK